MVLSTGRVLEHWHTGSMTRRAGVLDALEPEAVAFLSPRELRRLDLEPGDMMRLETRRGAIEVKVRADRDVPVGMVFMPFCYAEAAANLLTNPALDPTGKIPEFKFCAARVAPVPQGGGRDVRLRRAPRRRRGLIHRSAEPLAEVSSAASTAGSGAARARTSSAIAPTSLRSTTGIRAPGKA